jgi:hypothetical protein
MTTVDAPAVARAAESSDRQNGAVTVETATIAGPIIRHQAESMTIAGTPVVALVAESYARQISAAPAIDAPVVAPVAEPGIQQGSGATEPDTTTIDRAVEPIIRRQVEDTPASDTVAVIRAAQSVSRPPPVDALANAAFITSARETDLRPPSAVATGTASAPPPIQRQVGQSTTEAADVALLIPPAAAKSVPAESVPAEPVAMATPVVDLDDLARRVYADVKQRLYLEWERARGRQGR